MDQDKQDWLARGVEETDRFGNDIESHAEVRDLLTGIVRNGTGDAQILACMMLALIDARRDDKCINLYDE